MGTILLQVVEHVASRTLVVSIGQMDDRDDAGVNVLHSLVAAVDEFDEILYPFSRFRPPCLVEHAILGFIAYRHPHRDDALVFQPFQHVVGVFIHFLGQGIGTMVSPLRRNGLTARIGPRIAIVETDHDFQSLGMSAFAQVDDILFAAPATRWIHPHTEPHGIQPEVTLQDGHQVGTLSFPIAIIGVPTFLLTQPTDVGTECKLLMSSTVKHGLLHRLLLCNHTCACTKGHSKKQ